MLAQELVDAFRSDMQDQEVPYHWTDADVLRYVDEAQRQFCRFTRGISDGKTSAVCEIAVSAGELYSPLHPSVKAIRTARRGDGASVRVLNVDTADRITLNDYGLQRTSDPYARTGPVLGMVLGESDGFVKWLGIPDADDTVSVVVFRGPLKRITSGDDELEVPDDYDWVLQKWMQHMAYLKDDSVLKNETLSDRRRQEFLAACRDVKREQERKVHTPREISYGGL